MRLYTRSWLFALSLAGTPLFGQAIVEHSAISSAVAALAGSAKSATKTVDRALKKLDATLDTAAKKGHSSNVTAAAKSGASPARAIEPSPVKQVEHEDPAGIRAGMSYAEVTRRFGEPAMKISSGGGEEMLYYSGKDGKGQTAVRMLDGKVVPAEAARRD